MDSTPNISRSCIAQLFKLHPRSVQRIMDRRVDTPFIQTHEPHWTPEMISRRFGVEARILIECLSGENELIKIAQGADVMGIDRSTFYQRYKNTDAAIRWPHGHSVRFSKKQILALPHVSSHEVAA